MSGSRRVPELYPRCEPYRTGHLPVSELHSLYFEECGNPLGLPVVYLHGGPGAGVSPRARQFFDPARYRAVLYDQRGCGRSTPFAELRDNTTWELVADLERLREHLGIERWLVFGGSWGATLALAYGERHPERCLGFVLRGIYTMRDWESAWLHGGGVAPLRPLEWERFLAPIPAEEHGDLVAAYHRRLFGDDPEEQRRAAIAWSEWEASMITLLPDPELMGELVEEHAALAIARISAHFMRERGWLETEDELLRDVPRIAHLPCVIVHGRYDLICPPRAAVDLHRLWPGSELQLIPDAAHLAFEPSIARALVAAADAFAERFRG